MVEHRPRLPPPHPRPRPEGQTPTGAAAPLVALLVFAEEALEQTGSTLAEPELEAAFTARLPDDSSACRARLSQFFTQWFDTAYRGSKPQITGPGLPGRPFYAHGCTAPGRR